MSLIICKECGKSYSDKANSCPDCACPTEYNLELEERSENVNCIECGLDYDKSLIACPNCACPTEYNINQLDHIEKSTEQPAPESGINETIKKEQEQGEISDNLTHIDKPNSYSYSNHSNAGLFNLLFSTTGRASRKTYCLISIPSVLISFTCFKMVQNSIVYETLALPTLALLLLSILSILCGIADLCVTVRRLHDIDKSGYLALLLIVPLISTILWIALMLFKGTNGKNKFGEVGV